MNYILIKAEPQVNPDPKAAKQSKSPFFKSPASIDSASAIGIVAAIIDVTPMVLQKLDKNACISAGAHWIVMGLIIPFVNWGVSPWLRGLLIGVLALIPVLIIVYPQDKKAIIPMTAFSIVLGIGVSVAGAHFIG